MTAEEGTTAVADAPEGAPPAVDPAADAAAKKAARAAKRKARLEAQKASGVVPAKKERNSFTFPAPQVLRDRIVAEALAANKSERVYVRDMLAAGWGLVLPPPRTRTTYGTPEEKKAAQKTRRAGKAALVKKLLADYEASQAAAAGAPAPVAG